MIWVGTRIVGLIASALSSSFAPPGMARESLMQMAMGPMATLGSIVVVVVVAEIHRRRIGAPLLFANLGYSARWSAGTTGAIAIACEALLQVATRSWGAAQ